jgi:tRNA-specific 2-thiouridylase
MQTNTLWVVQGHDHPWLLSSRLQFDDASWTSSTAPALTDCFAKTRYRQSDAACAFEPLADTAYALTFPEPQWAVTPGQSAVLYDGEVCLGGGVIMS